MRRETVFGLIAATLSISASLGICEGLVRAFSPPWLTQRMADLNPGKLYNAFGSDRDSHVDKDAVGHFLRFTPGSSWKIRHYEYTNDATIDDLCGRSVPNTSLDAAHRLPFMGDSFTFGVGVEATETFGNLLATRPLLRGTRLLNLGIPGTALPMHLDIVERRHAELGWPNRYVFAAFLGNDLADMVHDARKSGPSQNVLLIYRDGLAQLNEFVYHNDVLKKLYLIQFVRAYALAAFNRANTAQGNDPQWEAAILAMDTTRKSYIEEQRTAIERQFSRLSDLQKRLGFASLIILIPDVHQLDLERLKLRAVAYGIAPKTLDSRQAGKLMAEAAGKVGLAIFDATECMAAHSPRGLYFDQDNHFRAAGHHAFAECIETQIQNFVSR